MLTFEQQQIESNHISFLQAFNKELAKQVFMHMDTQELNDSEKVSAIWFENHKIIVKKMNSIKPSMVDMKPKNAIKLDIVELDKFETYPEENILPKDGLCRYLYWSGEQHTYERCSIDFMWSENIYRLYRIVEDLGNCFLYYLQRESDGLFV